MSSATFELTAAGLREVAGTSALSWAGGATLLVRCPGWPVGAEVFVGGWRGIYVPNEFGAHLVVLLRNAIGDELWVPVPLQGRPDWPALCYAESGGIVAAPESWTERRSPTFEGLLKAAAELERVQFPPSPWGHAARRLLRVGARWRGVAAAGWMHTGQHSADGKRLRELVSWGWLPPPLREAELLHARLVRDAHSGIMERVVRQEEVQAWWSAVASAKLRTSRINKQLAPALPRVDLPKALEAGGCAVGSRGRAAMTLERNGVPVDEEVSSWPPRARAAFWVAHTRSLSHQDRARWEQGLPWHTLAGPKRVAYEELGKATAAGRVAATFLLLRAPVLDRTLTLDQASALLARWLEFSDRPEDLDPLGLTLVENVHRHLLFQRGDNLPRWVEIATRLIAEVGPRAKSDGLRRTGDTVRALREYLDGELTHPPSRWRFNEAPALEVLPVPTDPADWEQWLRDFGDCPRKDGRQHWPGMLDAAREHPGVLRARLLETLRSWHERRAPREAGPLAESLAKDLGARGRVPIAEELRFIAAFHPDVDVAAKAWLAGFPAGDAADVEEIPRHVLALLVAPRVAEHAAVRPALRACVTSRQRGIGAAALRVYARSTPDTFPVEELSAAAPEIFDERSSWARAQLAFDDSAEARQSKLRALRAQLKSVYSSPHVHAAIDSVEPSPGASAVPSSPAGAQAVGVSSLPWNAATDTPDFATAAGWEDAKAVPLRAALDATLIDRLQPLPQECWRERVLALLSAESGNSRMAREWVGTLEWAAGAIHDQQYYRIAVDRQALLLDELRIRHLPRAEALSDTNVEICRIIGDESQRFGLDVTGLNRIPSAPEQEARTHTSPRLVLGYVAMILRNMLLNAAHHVGAPKGEPLPSGAIRVHITSGGVVVANRVSTSLLPIVRFWRFPPPETAPGRGFTKVRNLLDEHPTVPGATPLRIVPWTWRDGPEAHAFLGLELRWAGGEEVHHDYKALYAPWSLVGPARAKDGAKWG